MRITFVHRSANFSGGNRVVAAYAERLKRRGHEVCVVTGADPHPKPLRRLLNRSRGIEDVPGDGRSWLDTMDVEHRVVPSSRGITGDDVPDADIIVATWWETAEWVAAMPRRAGHKAYFLQGVEWTIGGMPAERILQTWRLPLHKIVIAEFMREIAKTRLGDEDVSLVPNGVDTELFFGSPRGKQPVPTLGLMQVGPVLVKGWDVAHAALLSAKQQLPELRGLCFGRQPPPEALPLPEWVTFVQDPSPDQLRELYSSCDVFVHAARVEGFGLPLLEAMACRTPVAATRAGAAPELLPSGGGSLVEVEDSEALAKALVEICQLPEDEWRERSEAAYQRATLCDVDSASQKMEAALERAIEKGRAGAYAQAGAAPDLAASSEAATISEVEVGVSPFTHWTCAVRAEDSDIERALRHPHTLARLEEITGIDRLLVDPLARDEGTRIAGTERAAGHAPYFRDPPLRRVLTLFMVPPPSPQRESSKDESALELELWGDSGPSRIDLSEHQAVLVRVGRMRPTRVAKRGADKSPAEFAVVHYYTAANPDRMPELGPRVLAASGAPLPERLAVHARTVEEGTRLALRWGKRWVRDYYFGFD